MKAEIRGQRFEIVPAVDDATTQSCLRQVADYCAEAEANATVINSHIFALQAAYRLAKESRESAAAHEKEIARLKALHQRELSEAENAYKDLETEVLDGLKTLTQSLRALLAEFDEPPPAILRFPSRDEA